MLGDASNRHAHDADGFDAEGLVSRDVTFTDPPPVIGLPRGFDENSFATFLARLFPHSRIAARGNTESHIVSLVRAGEGIGLIDCFAGDGDPALRRFMPEPVD